MIYIINLLHILFNIGKKIPLCAEFYPIFGMFWLILGEMGFTDLLLTVLSELSQCIKLELSMEATQLIP